MRSGALHRALLAAIFALASMASEVGGASAPVVAVRLELVADAGNREESKRCEISREVAIGAKEILRTSFGEARPDAAGTWKATGSSTGCGEDGRSPGRSEATGSSAAPYLVLETSVTPLKASRSGIDFAVLLGIRKLTGFSQTGRPIYREVTQYRNFTLAEGEDGLVPVLLGDPREVTEFGIREVVLHLGARIPAAPTAEYGTVSIRSDTADADVLLDGGRVGRTSKEKTATLRNVLVGNREIGIRDSSGREARGLAQVRKDRTVLVALGVSSRDLSPAPNGLVAVGKNPQGYEEYRRKRDGAVMVKVPEGEFHMGNLQTENRPKPHVVYVSTFLMDKTPVTWKQFNQFLEASGWPLPPDLPYWGIHDDQPAAFVTWEESRAFCEWVGGRLPREAEREKAARGTDERKFPWGDKEPDPTLATFRHNWGSEASTAVGSHPAGASPYGLLDVAGNMWEWVEDWYDPNYFDVSPKRDPRGPATGNAHVVKGGSWDSRPSVLSSSSRNWGYLGYREGDFGFRCAADPPD